MALLFKCVALFVMGFLIDFLQTVHIQACAERQAFQAVGTIVAIYLVGFWGHNWFVQYKSSWARWALTFSGAVGAGAGTLAVIILGG